MAEHIDGNDRRIAGAKLVGGDLALDFANTADWHDTDAPEEMLTEYEDLLVWAIRAGAILPGDAEPLSSAAAQRPTAARAVLEDAVALRESLFRIFSACAGVKKVPASDLAALNEACASAASHRRIAASDGGYSWTWFEEPDDLRRPLRPIVVAAAELLVSDRLGRVKKCEDGRCGWLFLDTSRNRSRRWCDMADCGNRAKARRYYRRHRTADR